MKHHLISSSFISWSLCFSFGCCMKISFKPKLLVEICCVATDFELILFCFFEHKCAHRISCFYRATFNYWYYAFRHNLNIFVCSKPAMAFSPVTFNFIYIFSSFFSAKMGVVNILFSDVNDSSLNTHFLSLFTYNVENI